jgi:pSer/pThr/pTyr-binding forkhead associated (FHA) protein
MEVRCTACGNVQEFPAELFGGRKSMDIPCAACGQLINAINPEAETLQLETTRKTLEHVAEEYSEEGLKLSLPPDKELSLNVVEGPEKGTVYRLLKPRITVGRSKADVTIYDRTVSRLHCVVEIIEDRVVLRDLGSTNGTLVNNQPIVSSNLESGSTFRIGMHTLQLMITPKKT